MVDNEEGFMGVVGVVGAVGAVGVVREGGGEKLGGTGRNSEGLGRWEN